MTDHPSRLAQLKPTPPTDPADKKLAADWYTWGFQAGLEAEKRGRAREAVLAAPLQDRQVALDGEGKPVYFAQLLPMSVIDALRDSPCPRPCNGRPDDLKAGACYDSGECGCQNGAALKAAALAAPLQDGVREALEWYANEHNYHSSTGAPMTPYVDGKPDPSKPIKDFGAIARAALSAQVERPNTPDNRSCTCHPDDNPPDPCARRYASSECQRKGSLRHLVDLVWLRATEGEGGYPSTKIRDELIEQYIADVGAVTVFAAAPEVPTAFIKGQST